MIRAVPLLLALIALSAPGVEGQTYGSVAFGVDGDEKWSAARIGFRF